MEKKKGSNWLFRKFFPVIEAILILVSCLAYYLYYTATGGGVLLLIIGLSSLAACYMIKAFDADTTLGIKPRVIYFACGVPCLALMFGLLRWPAHTIILVAGLAGIAVGWGVFLWARTRQNDEKNKNTRAARQAASYMMLFRLLLYTTTCLMFLLTAKIV